VAVATEYGLYIDGAVVEAASGELRELHEPATGAPHRSGDRCSSIP
jgi:hypothetical protein